MSEEWRPVVGFPEYAVSSHGRVRRVLTDRRGHTPHILKPWTGNHGYLAICLCNEKGQYKRLLHRLVCEAFHGKAPTKLHQVAHNDGTRTNHHADNLRWATASENMEDARKHGTMAIGARHGRTRSPDKTPRGEKHGHAKLTEKSVNKIRSAEGAIGLGRLLAKKYCVSPATISNIRSGKTWRNV